MINHNLYRLLCMLFAAFIAFADVSAQEVVGNGDPIPQARLRREGKAVADSLAVVADTLLSKENQLVDAKLDSLKEGIDHTLSSQGDKKSKKAKDGDAVELSLTLTPDSLSSSLEISGLHKQFVPDPKKALWLAIVFPGGGQIYNRKYWKIPLVYGGFLGCMYALTWNNTMYRDYSQAYIDIMDKDDNTKSYENFIPKSYDIQANLSRLQDLFKRKKNFYRRYRDMSVFCMIGVYALSIVDAYVDAELSSFDISPELSMKVHPTIMNDRFSAMRASGMNSNSYGLQCSLNF